MRYSYKPTSRSCIDTYEIGCYEEFWCKNRCRWIKKIILRSEAEYYYSEFKQFATYVLPENKIEELVIIEDHSEYWYIDEELIVDIIAKNTNSLKKLTIRRNKKIVVK